MTALFVCADIHSWNHRLLGGPVVAGVNRRNAEVLGVLSRVCTLVARYQDGKGTLVVLGDAFDAARPSPQMERAFMDALAPLTDTGGRVVILVGNHDRFSDAPGDHALAPLGRLPGVTVVDEPGVYELAGRLVLLVPPVPRGGLFEDYLRDTLESLPTKQVDIVGVHAGIEDNATPHFLKGSRGAINVIKIAALAKTVGATEVYAGDWHSPRVWGLDGVKVVQCGALVPTGWDNPGNEYGRVYEVGADNRFFVFPGPRFYEAADSKDAENKLRMRALGLGGRDINYVRVRLPAGRGREVLKAHLEAVAAEHDSRVDVLPVESVSNAASTGERARSSVDEALAAAVDKMIEENARASVLARSRQYLAAAGG